MGRQSLNSLLRNITKEVTDGVKEELEVSKLRKTPWKKSKPVLSGESLVALAFYNNVAEFYIWLCKLRLSRRDNCIDYWTPGATCTIYKVIGQTKP